MYHFIVNPHSKTGRALKLWRELELLLNEKKVEYKTYLTNGIGHATILAREICEENHGIKQIVIVGGDGTANEVINGITDFSSVLLGYIPLGSSNDLGRGLKISKDPKTALEHILNPSQYRYVDHGVVSFNDNTPSHRFAVSSGIGYDAAICEEALTSKLKHVLNKLGLGKLIYILIAVKQVFTQQPVDAEIIVDGVKHLSVKKLVFMASMIQIYEGGGLLMAPKALDNDKKLTVCLVAGLPRLKILVLMPTIFFGKHTMIKGVQMIDCESISVTTKSPMVVHTDGEIVGSHTQIQLSCTKEQVRMIL